MKLFLDIDGVILDLNHSFAIYTSTFIGKSADSYSDKEISSQLWNEIWESYLETEFVCSLRPLVDVNNLSKLTTIASLYLVTGFPSKFRRKREKNLREVSLSYDQLLFLDEWNLHFKADLLMLLIDFEEAFIFVDDTFEQCKKVKDTFKNAVVFWVTNTQDSGHAMAATIDEIFNKHLPSIMKGNSHIKLT